MMNFTYPSDLPPRNWLDYIKQSSIVITFSKEKAKRKFQVALIREAQALIKMELIGKAIDRLVLGFHIDKDYFLINLKKSGLLRHSSYLKKRNVIIGIAQYFIREKDFFKWSVQEMNLWHSLAQFESFFKEMNRIMKFIDDELHSMKGLRTSIEGQYVSQFKALLVENDSVFLIEKSSQRMVEDLSNPDFYSKEEVSAAISMLVSRYAEKWEIKREDMTLVDTQYMGSVRFKKLITEACRMRAFLELEIDIETFGFTCTKHKNKYIVSHPDPDFEKSIEISNILYNLQNVANHFYSYWENSSATSLITFSDLIHSKMPDAFRLQQEPYSRFTLLLPIQLITEFLKGQQQFFKEEIINMTDIAKELLVPFENLHEYELRKGLYFEDFIRLIRFFRIQYFILARKLHEQLGKVPDQWIFQSLVARVNYEELVNYLTDIVSRDKVEIFLDMVCWKTTDTHQFLDLQYKPIVRHEDSCYIPLNVMGTSNLSRNIFASESRNNNNIKGLQMAQHTGLPDVLTRIFKKHGFLTAKEVPVHFNGSNQKEGDIDFLGFKDGVLFIAECKDAIHPTDTFELRSTWSHVLKAKTQLAYLTEALNNSAYANILFQSIGLNPTEVKTICSAIVMSNNKFWGYSINGFPIRDIRIFMGFMLEGNRNIRLEDKLARFRMWKNEQFEVDDLFHFLAPDGPHEPNFRSTEAREYKYGENLYRRTYVLKVEEVYKAMKNKYFYEYQNVLDSTGDEVNNPIDEY